MIRALSTAASGMEAQQTRLDVTANNIANVSTAGFKKSRAEFQDLMYQTLRAPGPPTGIAGASPTGLHVGMGVRTVSTQRIHTAGDTQQTGNQYDLAIDGNGFFRIALPSGQTAYSRDGAFKLNAEGQLVNGDGYLVDPGITIPTDAQSVSVGADGKVTVTLPNDASAVQVGTIQLATFANPAGLQPMGRNLFRESPASGTPVLATPGENGVGTVTQGTLELSNVKVVEEMIDLIAGQRAYEVNARVVKAADDMLGQTSNLR
jgi:flagellar basal-body rod protein FlgG